MGGSPEGEDVQFSRCGLEREASGEPAPMPKTNQQMSDFCVEHVFTSHADLSPPLGVHVSGIQQNTWDYIIKTCPAAQHLGVLRP